MITETLFTREFAFELEQQIATRFPDVKCIVTTSLSQGSLQYYIVGLWHGDTCLVTFTSYEKYELFLNLVRSLAGHLATEDERFEYERTHNVFALPRSDELQEAQWEHDVN